MKSKKFYMAGTEGTGEYIVLARTCRGRVGVRLLGATSKQLEDAFSARVRVEPVENPNILKKMAAQLPSTDWKQPGQGGQHRFSIVAEPGELDTSLRAGLTAIGAGKLKTEVNPAAPEWARNLVEELKAA